MPAAWEEYLAAHKDGHQTALFDFLRIPSVSADPARAEDVRRAGQWVVDRCTTAGLENARMLETGGHPVVLAEHLHAPGAPTVLLYGHFDTQPVDPLTLWTSPPFDPQVRDGRVYARGASDDKSNMFIPLRAVEALLQTEGRLPLNLKVIFEGQEEIGSPQLPAFLAAHREELACDLAVSADAGQWSETEGATPLGNRGLCGIQLDVFGPSSDLHSGSFGGAIANPLHALATLLAGLHDEDGRVTVAGFYDAVRPLSPQDRARIAAVPFNAATFASNHGVSALSGEKGYVPLEQLWVRPTIEVNGAWGGFQGEGGKTVLPAEAHAKLTCRLVADQDPEKIRALVVAHLEQHAPTGVRVVATPVPGLAYPYSLDADHWAVRATAEVLQETYGKAPYAVRTGGSVPVCSLFRSVLGVDTVDFGFGLEDEQFHAPNEFFRLSSFERGPVAYAHVLARLAARWPGHA